MKGRGRRRGCPRGRADGGARAARSPLGGARRPRSRGRLSRGCCRRRRLRLLPRLLLPAAGTPVRPAPTGELVCAPDS